MINEKGKRKRGCVKIHILFLEERGVNLLLQHFSTIYNIDALHGFRINLSSAEVVAGSFFSCLIAK